MTLRLRQSILDNIGLLHFPRIHHAFKVTITFLLVSLSFVFFRATSMTQALTFMAHIPNNLTRLLDPYYLSHVFLHGIGIWQFTMGLAITAIIFLELVQYIQARKQTLHILEGTPTATRYLAYYALCMVILLFGYFGAQNFIYFQF